MAGVEHEFEDYEEPVDADFTEPFDDGAAGDAPEGKKGYVGVHSVSFDDMQLKRELTRAIQDCGFEHPSEIQQQCIPSALQGQDVLGQAKSGMGKTAVFVLAVLHQLEPKDGVVSAIVIAHTRELAQQIEAEFKRFSKFMDPAVRVGMYVGGIARRVNIESLRDETRRPHIVIGTPGRLIDLIDANELNVSKIDHFVVDECDKVFEQSDMRGTVQKIFMRCPRKKQVLMFSATMTEGMRSIARKMMNKPAEKKIEENKLVLEGLVQYYHVVSEEEKSRMLVDLLDNLDFNQVMIFVKSTQRANMLGQLLRDARFPVEILHGSLKMPVRQAIMKKFKEKPNEARVLVSTDLVSRGVDVERVNVVVNYDMPETSDEKGNGVDTYLHRVGRAGRFGTRGIAVTFVSSREETEILNHVQERFDVGIEALPALSDIDKAMYTNA